MFAEMPRQVLGAYSAFHASSTEVPSTGLKLQEREADQPNASIVEVKKEWCYEDNLNVTACCTSTMREVIQSVRTEAEYAVNRKTKTGEVRNIKETACK
jgi:hypothetical protein